MQENTSSKKGVRSVECGVRTKNVHQTRDGGGCGGGSTAVSLLQAPERVAPNAESCSRYLLKSPLSALAVKAASSAPKPANRSGHCFL